MARLLIVEDQPELARLIASAARARGHAAVEKHLGEEALALAEAEPFDLVIVDLMLPDVRGTEVLDRLKTLGVPAIAISGVYKEAKHAQEATALHGARAFFEKPFDMDALLGAVEQVTGPGDPSAAVAVDHLEELEVPVPAPEAAADVVLPFAERERVWGAASAEQRTSRAAPQWATAGALLPGTIARLLNAYYQARHTGELKLRQGQMLKVVFFEGGQPVYAASNLTQERFARFCVRRGAIREEDVAAVAGVAKEAGLRTGDAMVQLGLIDDARRRELLMDQVKEIIWSTFSWSSGEYAFSARRLARSDLVKLAVFPGDLIMEGARREPLVVLRRKLPAERKLFPTSDPPYQLHELKLGGPEAYLLVWADGTKRVEDLVALSDLGEREVLGALYGFELLGVLEERKGAPGQRRITFGL